MKTSRLNRCRCLWMGWACHPRTRSTVPVPGTQALGWYSATWQYMKTTALIRQQSVERWNTHSTIFFFFFSGFKMFQPFSNINIGTSAASPKPGLPAVHFSAKPATALKKKPAQSMRCGWVKLYDSTCFGVWYKFVFFNIKCVSFLNSFGIEFFFVFHKNIHILAFDFRREFVDLQTSSSHHICPASSSHQGLPSLLVVHFVSFVAHLEAVWIRPAFEAPWRFGEQSRTGHDKVKHWLFNSTRFSEMVESPGTHIQW